MNQSSPQPTPRSPRQLRARWGGVAVAGVLLALADLAWLRWVGWLPVDKVVIAELLFLGALGFGLTLPTRQVVPYDAAQDPTHR